MGQYENTLNSSYDLSFLIQGDTLIWFHWKKFVLFDEKLTSEITDNILNLLINLLVNVFRNIGICKKYKWNIFLLSRQNI